MQYKKGKFTHDSELYIPNLQNDRLNNFNGMSTHQGVVCVYR